MALLSTDDVDERLVASLPLVRSVVASLASHYPRHCDRDELIGAGTLGLVEAAGRFDEDRGVPFERWAAVRVRGAVVDAVRAQDVAPRALRAAGRDLDAVEQVLVAELGRTPEDREVAARMGLSADELAALRGRLHRSAVVRLDAPASGGGPDDATLSAIVLHDPTGDPLVELERRERDSYVRDALDVLPDRLRSVVVGYFLHDRTSAELAEELGVTESRVSQLRSEGLELLRNAIAAQYGEPTTVRPGRAQSRQDAVDAALANRSTFAARLSLPRRTAQAPAELLAS